MKHMKIVVAKGTTAPDILDKLDTEVVKYMGSTRQIDEAATRKLIHDDESVRASYSRKIERLVRLLIIDGVPPAFFGRKA